MLLWMLWRSSIAGQSGIRWYECVCIADFGVTDIRLREPRKCARAICVHAVIVGRRPCSVNGQIGIANASAYIDLAVVQCTAVPNFVCVCARRRFAHLIAVAIRHA